MRHYIRHRRRKVRPDTVRCCYLAGGSGRLRLGVRCPLGRARGPPNKSLGDVNFGRRRLVAAKEPHNGKHSAGLRAVAVSTGDGVRDFRQPRPWVDVRAYRRP